MRPLVLLRLAMRLQDRHHCSLRTALLFLASSEEIDRMARRVFAC